MTALYLTEIELSQFRSFAHLKIELVPEPGVLIVHGSNGLGKSSLFDALEWTLTGDIDHFRSADGYKKFGTYLRRWGDTVGPTSSALVFSDGKRIERELASVDAVSPKLKGDVPDIAEYLRVPAWGQSISALNRYLLLTHFHSQSNLSRLTHRDPSERFAILKEAAYSADLEKFGVALHGLGTTQPARAFTKRIAELKRDAAELRVLLDQETETWSAAQAAGALNDAESYSLAQVILAKLGSAWTHMSPKPAPFLSADPADLATVQSALDQTEAEARKRDFAILEARRMLALRQRYEKALGEAAASAKQADQEMAAAIKAADNARQACTTQRAVLTDLLAPLTSARDNYVELAELAQAESTLRAARAEREQASASFTVAQAALTSAEASVQRAARPAQIVERLRGETNELLKSIFGKRAQIEKGRQWLARLSESESKQNELSALESAHPDIETTLLNLQETLSTARVAAETQSRALEIVQSSAGELSAAVSTISTHLSVDAHECPTCAAYYPSPAELKKRIDLVAQRLAPAVVRQQEALRAAEQVLTDVTAALAAAQSVFERINLLKRQIRSDRSANQRLLAELGWDPDCDSGKAEEQIDNLEHEAQMVEQRRARRLRWFNHLGRGRDLDSAIAAALRRRSAAEREETAAARRHEDASVAERVAEDTFQAYSARSSRLFPESLSLNSAHIDTLIQAATAARTEAQRAYDVASRALTERELRLASLQEAEAALRARLQQASSELDRTREALASLATQWRAVGWDEADMADARIEIAATNLNKGRDSLSEASALLRRLRDGREAWGRQQAHRAAFDRLVAEVDSAPNSTRDQVREAVEHKLAKTEESARATARSKEIAFKASTAIATAVSRFNAKYIEPLDQLTKSINQAILCDPRIGIGLRVNKRTIKQSALRDGELSPKRKIDPMLVHSEGQMAALAVSMLCAASLTYPWSRWRALILDDPLQHNDAIHAAAFADVVGSLIQAKDYQVLLSTHDLGQADFLRRKFEARKIPCAVLNLLGRGKAGVEAEFLPAKDAGAAASASA